MKLKLPVFLNKRKSSDHGRLDVVDVPFHRLSAGNLQEVRSCIESRFVGKREIVICCSRMKFIDSSGLGLLVELRRKMLSPSIVVLEGITDPVLRELFSLTRMDQVFYLTSERSETLMIFDRLC